MNHDTNDLTIVYKDLLQNKFVQGKNWKNTLKIVNRVYS